MTPFTLAESSDGLRGCDHVVVAGPAGLLRRGRPWSKVLKGAWADGLSALAKETSPGPLGRTASTWRIGGKAPARVTLAVLPDVVSRHLSPSRSHALDECMGKVELDRAPRTGVVLVLDRPEHHEAAVLAVARHVRAYGRKSRKAHGGEVRVLAVDAKGRPLPPPAGLDVLVASARWAAAQVDRPTSELDAAVFVEEARALVKGLRGVRSRVIVGDDLVAAGLGGIAAVGRAAAVAPRLLVLEHAPKGARRTVALVGKGIVYDTGGLALKARDSMVGMKGDMGGGAAVVGAFRTLVAGGHADRLLALVPLAENAIGPAAYRNDDILTLHSGRTVEVNNTDAEGRILLADAVSYAVRELGADVVVDAATLTGAQLIATGKRHAAVVSNREGLERLAVEAGRRSGDLCHPLPFAPELYQREFKSEVADMKNSVKDRANAQASCAAQFVWSHLEDTEVPWLHVDLAGPAHVSERGTGFGVALLREVARSLEARHLAE